jgi:hypothetical protein
MPLTSSFSAAVGFNQTSPQDLGTAAFPAAVRALAQLTSGTGAGQADLVFSDTRTLAASANESLDLAGSLVGAFGATLTFVLAAAGQLDATGYGVVAATGDLLKVANSGGTTGVNYTVIVIGTSA